MRRLILPFSWLLLNNDWLENVERHLVGERMGRYVNIIHIIIDFIFRIFRRFVNRVTLQRLRIVIFRNIEVRGNWLCDTPIKVIFIRPLAQLIHQEVIPTILFLLCLNHIVEIKRALSGDDRVRGGGFLVVDGLTCLLN